MKKINLVDKEISSYQKSYRESANKKLLKHHDLIIRNQLDESISRTEHELDELNCLINVAESRPYKIEISRLVEKLEKFVAEEKKIDDKLHTVQVKLNHLKFQINRVDNEYVKLLKLSSTDAEYAEKLRSNQKEVEILETELDCTKKKKNHLKLQNSKLRNAIDELRFTRYLFQNQWENVVGRLYRNKKHLVEMVEQVIFAFAKGTDISKRIKIIEKKGKIDFITHRREMQNIFRTVVTNEQELQFCSNKADVININDVDKNLVRKRAKLKSKYEKLTNTYTDNAANIKKFTNLDNIDAVVAKVGACKRKYFSNYLYLNELNQNITELNVVLSDTRKCAALAERSAAGKPHEKQNQVEILKSDLLNQQITNRQLKKKSAKTEKKLNKYYSAIQKMYSTIKIVEIPKQNDEHSNIVRTTKIKVNAHTLKEALALIEERLKFVMWNIYCWQRDTNQHPKNCLVHDIEFINCKKIEDTIPDMVHVCPQCSQNEDAANPETEMPLNRQQVLDNLKRQIRNTHMESRMHNLHKCHTTASRSLMVKKIL